MRRSVPALLLVLTTAGCTLNTDYFSEYRGRNILGNYGFEATGKWTIGTTDPAFLTWEAANADAAISSFGAAYTKGPDGTSPAYHLEIKNLITNGDFEGTVGDLPTNYTFWTTDTGGTANVGTYSPYSGNSLEWKSGIGGKLILDLKAALPAVAGWQNLRYRVRADYVSTSTASSVLWSLTDSGTTEISSWPATVSQGTATTLNENVQVTDFTTDEFRLWIGRYLSTAVQDLVVDNLRLLPDDGSLYTKAELPSLSSGVLKLLPGSKVGMYTLTLYVRDDPSTIPAGGSVANRFQAQNLTVKVTAAVKSGSREPDPTVFARTASWSTGWTKLTMNFGFDFYDDDSDLAGAKALTIALSPTINQTGTVDVGSLLVAQPVLTFNP